MRFSIQNISKPRFSLEKGKLELTHYFGENRYQQKEPNYFAISFYLESPAIINGVEYETGTLRIQKKVGQADWKWENVRLQRGHYLGDATDKAQRAFYDTILNWVNENITQKELDQAVKEAHEYRLNRQIKNILDAKKELKKQEQILDELESEFVQSYGQTGLIRFQQSFLSEDDDE